MTDTTLGAPAPAVYTFQPSFEVRVILRDQDPWFVAADVCAALEIANHRDAVAKLDADEKGVGLTDTHGGPQELTIISESGLYTLILRCRGATTPGTPAHRFRKWVTAEVLPAIRKTGRYQVEPEALPVLSHPERERLAQAMRFALAGLDRNAGNQMWAANRLRVRFGLAHLDQMRPDQLPQALAELERLHDDLRAFFAFRAELHAFLDQEIIGAGTPWTPALARKWRAKLHATLPTRPDWLLIARQLAQGTATQAAQIG